MSKGYVYLLLEVDAEGQESHKIGISKNPPEERVRNLQTGNPNKISLLKFYETANYKKVEHWLHGRYQFNKTLAGNEWFKLSDGDVFGFVDECRKADETISLLLKENHFFK